MILSYTNSPQLNFAHLGRSTPLTDAKNELTITGPTNRRHHGPQPDQHIKFSDEKTNPRPVLVRAHPDLVLWYRCYYGGV